MTHLSGLLLRVMRAGSRGAAAFVALVLVIGKRCPDPTFCLP
jgi:hypothetical protein